MQREIQVVVFDAVGTLIYAEPNVATAYAAAAHRYESKLDRDEIGRRFHEAFRSLECQVRAGDLCTSEETESERWKRIVAAVLSDVSDPPACFTELYEHFANPASWQLYTEATAVLAELRARGYRLGVASNFDRRLLGITAALEPLREMEFVLVSSQIGYRKPHRNFFEAILDAAGVRAECVLYVGDDPKNDHVAAQSSGMHSLLLDRSGRGEDSSTITDLRELLTSALL